MTNQGVSGTAISHYGFSDFGGKFGQTSNLTLQNIAWREVVQSLVRLGEIRREVAWAWRELEGEGLVGHLGILAGGC